MSSFQFFLISIFFFFCFGKSISLFYEVQPNPKLDSTYYAGKKDIVQKLSFNLAAVANLANDIKFTTPESQWQEILSCC